MIGGPYGPYGTCYIVTEDGHGWFQITGYRPASFSLGSTHITPGITQHFYHSFASSVPPFQLPRFIFLLSLLLSFSLSFSFFPSLSGRNGHVAIQHDFSHHFLLLNLLEVDIALTATCDGYDWYTEQFSVRFTIFNRSWDQIFENPVSFERQSPRPCSPFHLRSTTVRGSLHRHSDATDPQIQMQSESLHPLSLVKCWCFINQSLLKSACLMLLRILVRLLPLFPDSRRSLAFYFVCLINLWLVLNPISDQFFFSNPHGLILNQFSISLQWASRWSRIDFQSIFQPISANPSSISSPFSTGGDRNIQSMNFRNDSSKNETIKERNKKMMKKRGEEEYQIEEEKKQTIKTIRDPIKSCP